MMIRKLSGFVLILGLAGCRHCQTDQSCEVPGRCGGYSEPAQAPPAASPPAYSPPPQAYASPQPQYVAAQPMVVSQPQYVAAASPQAGETGIALGMSVVRLPIPIPKFYAVPKPPRTQLVQVQSQPVYTQPVYSQPVYMNPGQYSPPPVAYSPPVQASPPAPSSCQTDNEQLLSMMMALQQQQEQQGRSPAASASPPPAPAANQADLEARTKALSDKLDRLTEAVKRGE